MGYILSEQDQSHPDNKKVDAEGFDGPAKSRRCTDCLCLLILVLSWVLLTALGLVLMGYYDSPYLEPGDPYRLTNAIDYRGDICGIDKDVKGLSAGYYLPTGAVICTKKCPKSTDYSKFICYYDVQAEVDADTTNTVGWAYVEDNKCMYQVATKDVLNNCVYWKEKDDPDTSLEDSLPPGTTTSEVPTKYVDGVDDDWFKDLFADVYEHRAAILGCGLGVAAIIGFLYLLFLRIPCTLALIVWTLILSIEVLLLAVAYILYKTAKKWDNQNPSTHSQNEIDTMTYVSYGFLGCAALYFCLIVFLRSRIVLAIAVVRTAARAFSNMPAVLLMPIFQLIGVLIFLVPCGAYIVYLASSGDIETKKTAGVSYKTFEYNDNIRYACLYILFCFFWTTQFIIAFGQLVVALTVSRWYFTRDKSTISSGTFLKGLRIAFCCHLGTVAFGSLVIAIVKTIRAIISYLQKKAKQADNKLMKYALCCLQCCMWCVEKCLKFLNKHAYIQTAIHGYPFCKAARSAFFLIARNIVRVAAVKMVEGLVLFIGRVVIPLAAVVAAYFYLASGDINGLILPLLIVLILGYFVACMFCEVFGMAIETILQCFIADEEMFDKDPAKMFADGPLQDTLKQTRQSGKVKVTPSSALPEAKSNDNGPMP